MLGVAGECLIQVAGPQTLEVQGDIAVSGSLDHLDHRVSLVENRGELSEGNFEASGVFIVTHTHTGEVQLLQAELRTFHTGESLKGYVCPVRQTTGQTGCRGFVRSHQTKVSAQRTNVGLGQAGVDHRETSAAPRSRVLSGSMVTQVAEVPRDQHTRGVPLWRATEKPQ